MTMEFLPLTRYAGTGQGFCSFRALTRGTARSLGVGDGEGQSWARVGTSGTLIGDSQLVVPEIPALGFSMVLQRTSGRMRTRGVGTGASSATVSCRGQEGSNGASTLRATSYGYGASSLAAYGFLMDRAPAMSALGDTWYQSIEESVSLTSQAVRFPTAVLRAAIALQVSRAARYQGVQKVVDSAAFGDRAAWILRLLVQDGLTLGAVAGADYVQIARLVGRLIASGNAASVTEAVAQVTDGIVLFALASELAKGEITEAVKLEGLVDALYSTVARAVARVLLGGSADGHNQIVVVVRDQIALRAEASGGIDLLMALRESVGFAATLTLDDGEYVAWAMNTESKGLSRYTNYPFNSMAKIGRRYIGAASDGLHELAGDTDNGADIEAFIRAGLYDCGTRLLKRLPEVFIAYTSDGTLVLRAITVNREGHKVAAHYRLPTRGAGAKQSNRFKLGRGLESVDWAFELHNVDGSDFDISGLQFRPLMMSRRTKG